MSRASVQEQIKEYFSASSSVGASVQVSEYPEEPVVVKYQPDWKKIGIFTFATGSLVVFLIKRNTTK